MSGELRNVGIRCFTGGRGPGIGAFASVALFEHDLLVLESEEQSVPCGFVYASKHSKLGGS